MIKLLKAIGLIIGAIVVFDRAAIFWLYYKNPKLRDMLDNKRKGANDIAQMGEKVSAVLSRNGVVTQRIEFDEQNN